MNTRCDYFGTCGGCTVQDIAYETQLRNKEDRLQSLLVETLGLDYLQCLPTIAAAPWKYRHRARLSIRYRPLENKIFIGFRHRARSQWIVDLHDCPILTAPLRKLLPALHECLEQLDILKTIPQIELLAAENGEACIVRHSEDLSDKDIQSLKDFSISNRIHIFLQAEGPESINVLRDGEAFQPCYRLPDFDLTFYFPVTQFTQINPAVNRLMVKAVIDQLQPQKGEAIADLFSGVGNFALAAARRGARVSAWEWSQDSVNCAQANADVNQLQGLVTFHRDNLDSASQSKCQRLKQFDKFILDPPRSGAEAVMHCLPTSGQRRIVYVSCQPKTLARDGAILVHQKGYQLESAGLIDMFPHTDHIEAMAVFVRKG